MPENNTPDPENSVTRLDERRLGAAAQRRRRGETTAFELTSIRAAKRSEDAHSPMFLVCRGLQKGRPIAVRDGAWTMGRGPLCDVSLQGRGLSRTHLRVENTPETGVVIADAASTNGVFVNGEKVAQRALRDGDVVQLGPETVLRFSFVLECDLDLRTRQYDFSIIDDLTGVHNRRYLMRCMDHEMAFAARHGQPLCLMLVDADRFKAVNDRLGHQAGDAVIKQLAERIADALRAEDVFARVGGEEFAILSRGAHVSNSLEAAERIRSVVQARPFVWNEQEIPCTISIGGTMLRPKDPLDASILLRRADENLYRAKDEGRNRIFVD
jgi:diguanylate cyclase (GGDEF)-like protein